MNVADAIDAFHNEDISLFSAMSFIIGMKESISEMISSTESTRTLSFLRMCLYEKSMDKSFIPDNNGTCHISEDKVSNYLSMIPDDQVKLFIRKVIDNTTYVSYDRLLKDTNIAIDNFIKFIGNEPYALITTSGTYSIEHMMIHMVWHKLRYTNIRGIYDHRDYIPCDRVAWITDCIYRNENILPLLSIQMTKISIVSPYATPAITSILGEYHHIETNTYISSYICLLSDVDKTYESVNIPMIYFDHGISWYDTFGMIYHGIVPAMEQFSSNCLMANTPSNSTILSLEKHHQLI